MLAKEEKDGEMEEKEEAGETEEKKGKQDEGCEQLDFIHFQSTGLANLEH